jgi:hypothetical protein
LTVRTGCADGRPPGDGPTTGREEVFLIGFAAYVPNQSHQFTIIQLTGHKKTFFVVRDFIKNAFKNFTPSAGPHLAG